MKKFKQWLMVAILMVTTVLSAIPAYAETLVQEGTGKGEHDEIVVEVTFEDDQITAIEVVESSENEVLSEPVYTDMVDEIIANNSTDVEAISGSTSTSNGVKEAVEDAIKAAGVTLAAVDKEEAEADDQTDDTEADYDVVVVGAGGAGFSAAIEAASAGKSVALIEEMPVVGGNTLISGGEMNVPGNWVQEELDIEDSVDLYVEDTLKGGDDKGDKDMVQFMAENALPAAEWLRDEVGVEFYPDQLFQFGGHSVDRALIPMGHTGQELITKFSAKAEEVGVDVFTNTKAEELITNDDNQVVGVKTLVNGEDEKTYHAADAVILTTGGFGANEEMRVEYNEEYDDRYGATVTDASQGDGIRMAQEVGGAVTNMESIQTYPVADPETGRIALIADTRFDGAILINQDGDRFVEELERRDVISEAILSQPGGYAYQLWNEDLNQISNSKELHIGEYESMVDRGILIEADTIEEVAEHFDIDVDHLKETLAKVAEYAETGEDKDFNHRAGLANLDEGPYYLMKCTPSVHHTMGGLVINEKTEVLNEEGEPIDGLYAAGETTGVIHGSNRLGGNAVTDIIVFGRVAGQEAGAR